MKYLSGPIFTTIAHRPYVFVFLAAFLTIGILNRGPARTFLFLVLGFTIAWISEVSSTRNGFPYGMYHYIYENMQGEWILWGVPVWDSLSYSFVAYASYEMAGFFPHPSPLPRGERVHIVTTAIFMVLMDVVADPLAVRGDRWFLGRIYYYPDGGLYFGVPLSNFAGWLLVALTIMGSYQFLESKFFKKPPPMKLPLLGPLFYWGILAFNLALTFRIGEIALGLTGLAIHLLALASLTKGGKIET